MTVSEVRDLGERVRALDPGRSFIVQAPAGSGKTELLIQRYLVLLSRVEEPEEIAAITFTRKSTAEMRKRVLEALAQARSGARPAEPHRALTWDHARAALARDAARGWKLEENAARLRVQTIDALCASLTRQMPVLARFGAQPDMVDDASAMYREAAQATLALLDDAAHAQPVAALLAHLDNNVAVARGLIESMLAQRDQWLRAIHHGLDRERMEEGLRLERVAAVEAVCALYRPIGVRSVEEWQQHAEQLLTQAGTWRARSPAAQALAARGDAETLRRALRALCRLPEPKYTDEQWAVMEALVPVLKMAVAQLRIVFAARGQADFAEVGQGALQALGEPEEPTDLLLALDYRIRHLLVDEFQDTSYTQYQLLERLTAGWERGDGRTLFLVGDPMQSIYRFREADVGLFLRARHEGIGSVELEPLTLSANFRSQAGIVEWVNATFARVFPAQENIAAGAVSYAGSQPVRAPAAEGVSLHAFFDGDSQGEAERVVALIGAAKAANPTGTIAVLVRSRPHLEAIVPALRGAGMRFRAIEIEDLGHRQVVQDLLALTRALAHPADRTAWLAVLRAPWCGLTLADLHALTAPDVEASKRAQVPENSDDLFPETLDGSASSPHSVLRTDIRCVCEQLHDEARLARLGADGRARLERVRGALDAALKARLRGSLRERVERTWLALGGPACVQDDTDLEDADIYLDFLERSEAAGEVDDPAAFEAAVAELFALPDLHAAESDPQLLTIHKAKGLEFDTVIVPGLGRQPRRPEPSLLLWSERVTSGEPYLLLAPIKQAGAKADAIYDYLARLDAEKESQEEARLLYVAATRAKERLHLLGDVRRDAEGLRAPDRGSLLEKLWPAVAPQFERQREAHVAEVIAPPAREIDQRLRRLPSGWHTPAPPPGPRWSAPPEAQQLQEEIEFSWAGETARRVGTVVHRWLQRIADDSLRGWDRSRVEGLSEAVRRQLVARGVVAGELDSAARRVLQALVRSIEDERGRWVLGARADARSELRVSAMIDGRRLLLVVDRVFTGEDGRRWIVDYKTSSHEGADREAFLDRERERYAAQLERYARALGVERASLGLYFPLLTGWREWQV